MHATLISCKLLLGTTYKAQPSKMSACIARLVHKTCMQSDSVGAVHPSPSKLHTSVDIQMHAAILCWHRMIAVTTLHATPSFLCTPTCAETAHTLQENVPWQRS